MLIALVDLEILFINRQKVYEVRSPWNNHRGLGRLAPAGIHEDDARPHRWQDTPWGSAKRKEALWKDETTHQDEIKVYFKSKSFKYSHPAMHWLLVEKGKNEPNGQWKRSKIIEHKLLNTRSKAEYMLAQGLMDNSCPKRRSRSASWRKDQTPLLWIHPAWMVPVGGSVALNCCCTPNILLLQLPASLWIWPNPVVLQSLLGSEDCPSKFTAPLYAVTTITQKQASGMP